MTISLLLLVALFADACVKKIAGESPEAFKARKKAIYSAQVVTSFGALTDLSEIFVESAVLDKSGGVKTIELADKALTAADTFRERLQVGFDANKFQALRQAIADIEKARKDGAFTFKSQKAADFYFDALATTEVTLNLIEALQAGTKEPSTRAIAQQTADRLRAGSDEPKWWNRAIVKATEIARILAAQGSMDAATAWADADARSKAIHAKNKSLLESWKG